MNYLTTSPSTPGNGFGLAGILPPFPRAFGMAPALPPKHIWLGDLHGMEFLFYLHSFHNPLPMQNVVYSFVNASNYVGYIGHAGNLKERQRGHEHRAAALRLGYDRLYVHWQKPVDRIDYKSAEQRLINAYNPPLNTQHKLLP